jgi:hypothetical protein
MSTHGRVYYDGGISIGSRCLLLENGNLRLKELDVLLL